MHRQASAHVPSFGTYLTISEAAAFLGVAVGTLRHWDRAGKLTPRRHPLNGYRLYRREELEALLRLADGTHPGEAR